MAAKSGKKMVVETASDVEKPRRTSVLKYITCCCSNVDLILDPQDQGCWLGECTLWTADVRPIPHAGGQLIHLLMGHQRCLLLKSPHWRLRLTQMFWCIVLLSFPQRHTWILAVYTPHGRSPSDRDTSSCGLPRGASASKIPDIIMAWCSSIFILLNAMIHQSLNGA